MRRTMAKVNSGHLHDLLVRALTCPLILKALRAAEEGFEGKTRKLPPSYPRQVKPAPYLEHVIEVMLLVAYYGYSPEVVAAAILHDHLEDLKKKGWTKERMRTEFGDLVTEIVLLVTKPEKGTWEEKAEGYRNRLATAAEELADPEITDERVLVVKGALAVCAADKVANMRSSAKLAREGFPMDTYLKNPWDVNYAVWEELLKIVKPWVHPLLTEELENQLERTKRYGQDLDKKMTS